MQVDDRWMTVLIDDRRMTVEIVVPVIMWRIVMAAVCLSLCGPTAYAMTCSAAMPTNSMVGIVLVIRPCHRADVHRRPAASRFQGASLHWVLVSLDESVWAVAGGLYFPMRSDFTRRLPPWSTRRILPPFVRSINSGGA